MTKRGYISNYAFGVNGKDKESEFDNISRSRKLFAFCVGCMLDIRHKLQTVAKHPHIIIYSLIMSVLLIGAALTIVQVICQRRTHNLRHQARWEALETGHFFADEFGKTLIPLRSLQQAVIHSNLFQHLPHQIGNYGVTGSAPAIFGAGSTTVKDYRDVTGICDDPILTQKFNDIVSGITSNFAFDGIIVNYRLAPYGVFCLADPLINTKDFSYESPMDSTTHIGWDPINSPSEIWGTRLRKVYNAKNEILVFGPLDNSDGVEIFCAHLAVNSPGYNYTLDGETKSTYGFVMHFIHWSNLKEASGIDARFNMKEMNYLLTRTDQVINPATGMTMPHLVTLATNIDSSESKNHDHLSHLDSAYSSVTIQSPTGEEWTMRVSHRCELFNQFIYIRIATVLGCVIVTLMFAIVLLERQLHKLLLYKIMPERAIEQLNKNETVVDHYSIVTIFFSDIVGFTSIAGDMRPIQVMKMLNELYVEFDRIVEKHGVYKVETIGDAFMVVGGAPDRVPAPEAAQKVALFALEIIEFVKNFRTTDGERIYIRTGIASGPVVAGVIGKSMPRYCFFGDTVNIASRMESSSKIMKIQCSDFTYRLLRDAPNFTFDIVEREENGVKGVSVKGKGMSHTWWINSVSGLNLLNSEGDRSEDIESRPTSTNDAIIQSISLSRQKWMRLGLPDSPLVTETDDIKVMINRVSAMLQHRLSIAMEQRKQSAMSHLQKTQLRAYVSEIASLYKPVNFHNFEHAVHVTTSMHKLIDTIVSSIDDGGLGNGSICQNMWQNSFIHFVMIFACLIHDVEHTGQSNKILQAKGDAIAKKYPGPSAERNSIQTALDLLFSFKYKSIRKAIFPRVEDRFQFGKCIFWAILCTDIASLETMKKGLSRFDVVHTVREEMKASEKEHLTLKSCIYDVQLCPVLPYLKEVVKYLRLTQKNIDDNPEELVITQDKLENCVVVEHLMQVCDVAHLMQGWEIFLKFNYRLYKELMACHEAGAMPDPSPNWNVGQIGFFTNYVIPLAERVEKICGSDISPLTLSKNAIANMKRWQEDGHIITGIFVSSYGNGESESDILRCCLASEDN